MRRAYSIHEMKEYLKLRAEIPDDAASVLQRLKEQNYIDDARYARDYARAHAQGRRQGKFRIARELRVRGVPDKHIDAALAAVFAETDESALVGERLERKLRQLRGPLDERKRASIYRSLLRAGFPADAIRAELRAATKPGIPEHDDDNASAPSGDDI